VGGVIEEGESRDRCPAGHCRPAGVVSPCLLYHLLLCLLAVPVFVTCL
jgi:hypothetical protein